MRLAAAHQPAYLEPSSSPCMGNRACCRSCRHCTPPSGVEMGWCQLRKLPIHAELATELWCHHWTARPPRLPLMGDTNGGLEPECSNQQLALANVLDR